MAVESCTARVTGRVTEAALRLRQPARRFAGTVRIAVTFLAIIVGAYSLLVGSVYCFRPWTYYDVGALVQTSAGFAFITAIMDIALIFGVLVKDDKILHYILCASMAVYMVCAPLSLCTFLGGAICGFFDIPLWEIPRMAAYMLHLGVMYCLLAELRGDPLPPLAATPPPPLAAEGAGVGGGWLKNNLARTGPPAPGHAGDEALLKVQVERPRYNNAPDADPPPGARPGGGGPAVFAPSSCTTAPPVHPAYPPPPVPAPAPAPAAVSGPPSTSEA